MEVLDAYVTKKPDPQNILDLFADEWSCAMPAQSDLETKPGFAKAFEDARIRWAAEVFGGFQDKSVLELGPLEAGHTYMLEKMGARKIVSIEANTRAFLKCLCIKEIFHLQNAEFHLGDFIEFLQDTKDRFDVAIASGVLYHMMDPLQLIELLARVSNKLFLWTHFYHAEGIAAKSDIRGRFRKPRIIRRNGADYEWAEQHYEQTLNWIGFCGGSKPTSRWLTRESIVRCLRNHGYQKLEFQFDTLEHPNGPALAICAER